MEKEKKKKVYKIELTRLSIALWSLIFVVLIVWSFILGLLIGAGIFSEKEEATASQLKAEPHLSTKEENKKNENPPKFSFHRTLTSPKPNSVFKEKCYSVQVAAFLKEKDAINLVNRLKRYGSYYVKKATGSRTYYRVRCGKFDNKEDALALKRKIQKETSFNGIIVRCNK